MARVPPTKKADQVAAELAAEAPVQMMGPPLEIVVHAATMNVRKIDTPDGELVLIQLLSPTGIMFTLKFDEAGADALASQLKGSDIVIPKPSPLVLP